MKAKLISNLLSSATEKLIVTLVQFASVLLLVRILPRDNYGIIGVVAGYYTFVNICNVSLESALLRDHLKFGSNINAVLSDLFAFNIGKSALYVLIAIVFSFALNEAHFNGELIPAICSITIISVADMVVAPFVVYAALAFDQKLVTAISVARTVIGFALLCGLVFWPSLWYVAIKDFIVCLVFVAYWLFVATKRYKFRFAFKEVNFRFLRETFLSYSVWIHINGVITGIIARSDVFFLSFFVSLSTVGNYNIGLTSANVAQMLPMILGYQNSVALSHAKDSSHAYKISNAFVRISIYLSVVTIAVYAFLGRFYIKLLTGSEDNGEIFFYMICIVVSIVLVRTFASPLVAFLNIFSDPAKIVRSISVPVLLVAVCTYYCACKFCGATGAAVGNIVISTIWLILVFNVVRQCGYKHNSFTDFVGDFRKLEAFFCTYLGRRRRV